MIKLVMKELHRADRVELFLPHEIVDSFEELFEGLSQTRFHSFGFGSPYGWKDPRTWQIPQVVDTYLRSPNQPRIMTWISHRSTSNITRQFLQTLPLSSLQSLHITENLTLDLLTFEWHFLQAMQNLCNLKLPYSDLHIGNILRTDTLDFDILLPKLGQIIFSTYEKVNLGSLEVLLQHRRDRGFPVRRLVLHHTGPLLAGDLRAFKESAVVDEVRLEGIKLYQGHSSGFSESQCIFWDGGEPQQLSIVE